MNWTAAVEQRQNALLRVFYMLIFMTLLVVRAGLDARGATSGAFPGSLTLPDAVPTNPRSSLPPSHLYPAALRLMRAAEAVLRRLGEMTREIFELMNEAHAQAMSLRGGDCETRHQCDLAAERLDSS